MKFSLVTLAPVFLNGVVTKRKKYDGLNLKFAGAWLMVHTNVLWWEMEFIGRIFDIASSRLRSIEGLEVQCQVYQLILKGDEALEVGI